MTALTSGTRTALDRVLERGSVRTLFQPIVDLQRSAVVAAEALSRGPRESPLERPDLLFGAAFDEGKTVTLDQLCIRRAVSAASRLDDALGVFVNVEPTSLAAPGTARVLRPLGHRLVLEVTERHLARDPAAVLRSLDHARDFGARVALDDVGVDPASVAMLSLVRPDVIKLDLSLIQGQPNGVVGHIATAVMAHAERTGAVLLAEGIETEAHLRRALSLGASLGQGYYFGAPATDLDGALPVDPAGLHLPAVRVADHVATTPFSALPDGTPIRNADTSLLLQISKHLEYQAGRQSDLVLLGAFQIAERFTPDTARRYASLASELPFVAAVAVGLADQPAPGVRGARLGDGDPLAGEWSVVALGPHYCGALIARDLGDTGARHDRRFEYVVTHDRDLVTAAARSIMARVTKA